MPTHSLLAHRITLLRGALIVCLFSATSLCAQQSIPKKIAFSGAGQYSSDALLAISGLHVGEPLTTASIRAAGQKLVDTGLFSNIQFGYEGTTLTFTLTPFGPENFFPVRYDNFVWWTQDELVAELEKRVPLFNGKVSKVGNEQNQIIAALTDMLKEKGVTATVSPLYGAKDPALTVDDLNLVITDPPVHIRNVTIEQASPEMTEKFEHLRSALAGTDYSERNTAPGLISTINDIYHNYGYLDLSVTDFHHGTPVIAADHIDVDIAVTAHEGPQYRINAINWAGSTELSAADFKKSLTLKPGDVASRAALNSCLLRVAAAYSVNGYMRADVSATPQMDRLMHTVTYTVNVKPGEQYFLKSVSFAGLSDTQRAAVMKVWKLQPGSVYNENYIRNFLLSNRDTLHSLDGFSASYKNIINDDTHMVDMTMTFVSGGTLR